MKITHIIPFYAPAWGYGGPVRVSFELTKALAKQKYQVEVLTTDALDHSKRINNVCEEIDRVKIRRFKNLSNSLAKEYNLFLPLGFSKYCKLNLKNTDIIHLHSFYHFLNVTASGYARKYHIPYVLHLHENPSPEKIFGKVWLKKLFNLLWGKKMLFGADKIIALTEQERKLVTDRFPALERKIEVLPNPIKIRPAVKESKASLRKKYGLDPSGRYFIFLSRLSNLKRVDLILKILFEMKDSSKLLVVGPDEASNRTKLEKLAEDLALKNRVIFWGATEGREKDELLALSDLFIMLSVYESFSITSLEALEQNLPVCLSRGVGIAGEVLRFNCGQLILNPENAKKSSIEIEKAYNDRASLSKNCRLALKQFNISEVVNNLEKIYLSMIKPNTKQ